MKAIETKYRGYEFRSRLEAKWAAFFDLCEWPWSYEPIDLNGWIPDFALGESATLVEVKPFLKAAEWKATIQKIVAAGPESNVVLLGADPVFAARTESNRDFGDVTIGFLLDLEADGFGECLQPLHFGLTEGNNKPGLCPMEGGWSNIIWEAPNDISHSNTWSRVWLPEIAFESELVARWAKACNMSKWMPVAKRGAA